MSQKALESELKKEQFEKKKNKPEKQPFNLKNVKWDKLEWPGTFAKFRS